MQYDGQWVSFHPMRRTASLAIALLLMAGAAHSQDTGTADVARQREAAEERYQRLMAEGMNADATAAGTEVVALVTREFGPDSIELASPLTNLATAQLRSGDLPGAEASYQAAISLLEKNAGYLSARLINPLVGLGETYVRGEQYPLATQTYERALRVNHVNEGFYNLDQIRIRDGLTESYLGQQDVDKATFHQEAQVYVHQRKLGKDSSGMVGPLAKLGQWYDRSGQTEAARLTYQGAARIVAKADGENASGLVEPLLAIAETYRQEAQLPPDPESNLAPETLLALSSMTLRKALDIADKQSPPDPEQRARILVKMGDLYMMWNKPNTALDRYKEAWRALSTDTALEVRRDEYFAKPARIMGPVPPTIFPVPSRKSRPPAAKDLEPGFVAIRFSVDQFGRVTEATVIEADPANLLEERVQETARNTLFRPRYEDGAPVATTDLVLRHEFRYAPGKLEKKESPPAGDGDKPLAQPTSGPGS